MVDITERHQFTKLEIKQAAHEFEQNIVNYFGEVWKIKSDGEYRGVQWDCINMITMHQGLWLLVQRALHLGAIRAAGHIEVRDTGHVLRFTLYFARAEEDKRIIT